MYVNFLFQLVSSFCLRKTSKLDHRKLETIFDSIRKHDNQRLRFNKIPVWKRSFRENFFAIRIQCLLSARHNSPIIHLSVYRDDLMTFFNLLKSPNVTVQDLVTTYHQFRSHNDDRRLHNFHYLIYLTT